MENQSIFSSFVALLFIVFFFTGIFILIAKFESRNKVTKLTEKNTSLIWLSIAFFILLIFGLTTYANGHRLAFRNAAVTISFPLKLLMAILISREAKRQNRNGWVWFFIAFIEFHSAMIALGLSKSIYKVSDKNKSKIKELNSSLSLKIKSLKNLLKNELKSSVEVYNEIDKLKANYAEQFSGIVKENEIDNKVEKLENALKTGAITQEEYNLRVGELRKSKK